MAERLFTLTELSRELNRDTRNLKRVKEARGIEPVARGRFAANSWVFIAPANFRRRYCVELEARLGQLEADRL